MILPPERRRATVARSKVHADPDQPRKHFPLEEQAELAGSLGAHGQWVPVIVRPYPARQGEFILIDGERRWRALGLVPCDTIDVEIVDGPLDPVQLRLVQTSLGLTAKKLDVLETGESCTRLIAELGLSPRELAGQLGTSEGTISKLVRILRDLAEVLREDVRTGALPFTVAYHLARLKDPAAQADLAAKFKAGLLKRDSVAEAVSGLLTGKAPKKPKPVSGRTAGGMAFNLPADLAAAKAEVARLLEGLTKAERLGLPVASVPQLLRG